MYMAQAVEQKACFDECAAVLFDTAESASTGGSSNLNRPIKAHSPRPLARPIPDPPRPAPNFWVQFATSRRSSIHARPLAIIGRANPAALGNSTPWRSLAGARPPSERQT